MNFLAWILSLSTLIWLMTQAIFFHQATICRQKAWLKGTELITRSTLHKASETEQDFDLGCKLSLVRNKSTVTWRRLPTFKEHTFTITLEGKL